MFGSKSRHRKKDNEKREAKKQEKLNEEPTEGKEIGEGEDRPGFADWVYKHVYFEWFYRVSRALLAPTEGADWS